MNRIIAGILILVTYSFQTVFAQTDRFVWGINGHPLTQYAYNIRTWDKQIAYLQDLQIQSYRIDMPLKEGGLARNYLAIKLFNVLKAARIDPLPVVFPRENRNLQDSNTVYKHYREEGMRFARQYASYFDIMEVGNEWDLKIMKKGIIVDGTKESHYNLNEAKYRMWLLKGFIDGVKSVKPVMKVSLSFTWVHWFYLELLKQYNVNYDIIGWHWYSNMGDITNVRKPYGNVLLHIKQKFKKNIWITEFNTWMGTTRSSLDSQKEYIQTSIKNLHEQGIVKGFFIYELFDQPNLAERYPKEARYGIIYRNDSGYVQKPAYLSYKEAITALNNYYRQSPK